MAERGSIQRLPLHHIQMEPGKPIPFVITPFQQMEDIVRARYPHRHSFYEVVYVTGGQGLHLIDFEAYPIEPSSFYFISPGQVHYWRIGLPVHGYAILFTNDFLLLTPTGKSLLSELAFFHTLESSPHLKLTAEQVSTIAPLIDGLETEYQAQAIDHPSVLRAYLHILLVRIQRIYESLHVRKDPKGAPALVREFKRLVSEHCVMERSVQALACMLGVTAGHLSKVVRNVTGLTPGQIIRETLVLEAKRLIGNTDLTVTQIADSLRFEDPSYFARFFKRETGVSPCDFRQHIREKYRIFPE